jgi:hypothetical protein
MLKHKHISHSFYLLTLKARPKKEPIEAKKASKAK